MRICLLSKLHVSDSNVVCSEGDADLPHVGPDVSTDAVLQRLVYNCYKRKTNLIGLNYVLMYNQPFIELVVLTRREEEL